MVILLKPCPPRTSGRRAPRHNRASIPKSAQVPGYELVSATAEIDRCIIREAGEEADYLSAELFHPDFIAPSDCLHNTYYSHRLWALEEPLTDSCHRYPSAVHRCEEEVSGSRRRFLSNSQEVSSRPSSSKRSSSSHIAALAASPSSSVFLGESGSPVSLGECLVQPLLLQPRRRMSSVSRWFATFSSSHHHGTGGAPHSPPPSANGSSSSAAPGGSVLGMWRPTFNNEQWLGAGNARPGGRSGIVDECPLSTSSSESSIDDLPAPAAELDGMTMESPATLRKPRLTGMTGGAKGRCGGKLEPSVSPPPLHRAAQAPVSSPCPTESRTPQRRLGPTSVKARYKYNDNTRPSLEAAASSTLLSPTPGAGGLSMSQRMSLDLPPPSPQRASFLKTNREGLADPGLVDQPRVLHESVADRPGLSRALGINPLSAQSTLESLSLHPGINGTHVAVGGGVRGGSSSSLSAASPSSIATVSSSSQGGVLSSLTSNGEAVPNGGNFDACASATSASLASLFACVSPYLSPADVRMTVPLTRLYDPRGPVVFATPPLKGMRVHRGELKLWDNESERVVSQNSSNRRVHRAIWVPATEPTCPRPAAIKFVEDANPRDGRSLKREIECHIYVYQKLPSLFQLEQELRAAQVGNYSFTTNPEWSICERMEDAWPSAELFGYHLDKKNPGKSVLLTRKLSGPDLFDVIRAEHNHNWHFHHPANQTHAHKCRAMYSHGVSPKKESFFRTAAGTGSASSAGSGSSGISSLHHNDTCAYYPLNYEYHKLRWCALALKRIAQYASLSIRHNDVKPDNIVLDFYTTRTGHDCLDVKLIDLGTASMHNAKDFTGGTSWYESPEQKLLEYFMKKKKKADAAKRVDIDLPSDLWGAGISLAEVLVGKRVVDSLKQPHGPGSLEYMGFDAWHTRGTGRSACEESGGLPVEADCKGSGGHLENYPYWAMDPGDWIVYAKKALALDRENTEDRLTLEAARWIFSHLVRPNPSSRMPINVAMTKLERFAEEAWKRFRYVKSSFDHSNDANSRNSNSQNSAFCISPETTSASTPAAQVFATRLAKNQSSYRHQILQGVTGSKFSIANAMADTPVPDSSATPGSSRVSLRSMLQIKGQPALANRGTACRGGKGTPAASRGVRFDED
eukprot:Gregarina_sp_Poly_1__9448@NODE_592_length_7334_cov_17_757259_g457_i0_p1_GENE_NODE_592_length_7334_cov_17_757259_g457_i0NODE_592_length_7334_cov_17_757259_g457_i0_p1_ORF_typecomplete_len1140_score169_01Pkinase/PF00069_25/6_6e13Pkinase_Tyr/PF07714_17/0_00036Kdo/PF06293_14/4_7e03Kdo/PF06293_14/0_049_NODE_592_length_7334_cov_17_757259_g457_i01803599